MRTFKEFEASPLHVVRFGALLFDESPVNSISIHTMSDSVVALFCHFGTFCRDGAINGLHIGYIHFIAY